MENQPHIIIRRKDDENGPRIKCETNISLLIDKDFKVFTKNDDLALRRMFPRDSCIFVEVLKEKIEFAAFKFKPGSIKIGTTVLEEYKNVIIGYDNPVPLIIGNMEFVITPVAKTGLIKRIFKSIISWLTAPR